MEPLPAPLVGTLLAVAVEAGLAPDLALAVLTRGCRGRATPARLRWPRIAVDPAVASGSPFVDDVGLALRLASTAGVAPHASCARRPRPNDAGEGGPPGGPLAAAVLLVLPSGLLLLPAAASRWGSSRSSSTCSDGRMAP